MKIGLDVNVKKALEMGRDLHGRVVIDVPAAEIPAELRGLLQPSSRDGEDLRLPYRVRVNEGSVEYDGGYSGGEINYPEIGEATLDTLIAQLRYAQEAPARVEAECREKTLQVLRERSTHSSYGKIEPWWPDNPTREIVESPEAKAWIAELEAENDRREQAAREEREQDEARKTAREAEQAAREARKLAQLTAIVQELGTEVQRQKWADGFMAGREVIDLFFADQVGHLVAAGIAAAQPSEYVGDPDEIEHSPDCGDDGGESEYSAEDIALERLSDESYEKLRQIREILKDKNATVKPMREVITCDRCAAKIKTAFFRATWTVGELEVVAQVC